MFLTESWRLVTKMVVNIDLLNVISSCVLAQVHIGLAQSHGAGNVTERCQVLVLKH